MKLEKYRGLLIGLLSVLCVALLAGAWYLFDTNVDRSGWLEKEGVYSYRDFHGRKVTGWQEIDGKRYHFTEEKTMTTYWLEYENERYYFGADGALDTGWLTIEGDRYYTSPDGAIQTGWQDIEFQRYYLGDDGILRQGWLEENGDVYYLGEDGAMSLGFVPIDGETYYFGDDGILHTGPLTLEEGEYLFGGDGVMYTGWLEEENATHYYHPDTGILATGWQEIQGDRYYFSPEGDMQTGWLEQGEYAYYLLPEGPAAVGKQEIDGQTHFFTPMGIHVVLVNTQYKVPDYYDPNLVTLKDWHRVSAICLEPLQQMLADCNAAGIQYTFNSGFRSRSEQQTILQTRTAEYEARGMDSTTAYMKARETVALPGTSEHHLGLAVDILGAEATAWLREHCWEYGFILRYTAEKAHITGFVDEPWHFRYVGTEVSMDMKDSGLCLEEYLGAYSPNE